MTAMATDLFADGWLSSPPQYRTDLDRCEPAEALSPTGKRGRWRTMSFETDDVAGTMIAAGPETAAPAVSFPLRASGWHAVSVGIVPNFKCTDDTATIAVPVKLSGEDTCSLLTLDLSSLQTRLLPDWHGPVVAEMFWKIADLTDMSLDICQMVRRVAPGDAPGSFSGPAARVAYVKLVPLTDDELEIWQADQARTDTRRLFAHNDSHGPHYLFRLTTEEEVRREIEPYRDTDVSRIYWEAGGGDRTRFFSRIARAEIMEGQEDFGRRGDRMHAESWRDFQQQGVDPFDVAVAHTHALGMEFHACYRVAGFKYPPPLDGASLGEVFFDRHPECRGEDRVGKPHAAHGLQLSRGAGVRDHAAAGDRGATRGRGVPAIQPPHAAGGVRAAGGGWLPTGVRARSARVAGKRRALAGLPRAHADGLHARAARGDGRGGRGAWLTHRRGRGGGGHRAREPAGRHRPARLDRRRAHRHVDSLQLGAGLRQPRAVLDRPVAAGVLRGPGERHRLRARAKSHAPAPVARGLPSPRVNRLRGRRGPTCSSGTPQAAAEGANFRPMWSGLRRLGHQDEIAAWQAAGEPALPHTIKPMRKWNGWDFAYETPG